VTSALLSEFVSAAQGHQVEQFRLREHQIEPCVGCLRCRPDKPCVLPRDGAHELGEAIIRSDVVVIGTPVYWGNVPAPLKAFFDRSVTLFTDTTNEGGWHVSPPRLRGKRAMLIVTGIAPFPANLLASQGGGAVRAVKTVLKAGGVRVVRTVNVAASDEFEAHGERYRRRVRALAGAL